MWEHGDKYRCNLVHFAVVLYLHVRMYVRSSSLIGEVPFRSVHVRVSLIFPHLPSFQYVYH